MFQTNVNDYLVDTSDSYLTVTGLIVKYGFDYEEHEVMTDDKYLLKVYRIKNKHLSAEAPVAFMQHGMFSHCETFVMNAERSPAFVLAHAGFDVWLGNNRGDPYSERNLEIDQIHEPNKFYNYSFVDFGQYDAPAQINYVLNQTGKNKLHYIGHSQGTT